MGFGAPRKSEVSRLSILLAGLLGRTGAEAPPDKTAWQEEVTIKQMTERT